MRHRKRLILAALVALITIAVVFPGGCTGSRDATETTADLVNAGRMPVNARVQSSDAGAVKIDVRWNGLTGDSFSFDVSMNTHSVDLDTYDLGDHATLRDDTGNEFKPVSWDGDPGGHHRSGTLVFPVPDSVERGSVKYVQMVIRGLAGVSERVLQWQF